MARSKLQSLSDTQQKFVENYCRTLNATRAIQLLKPDMERAVASSTAHRYKADPRVSAEITKRLAQQSEWADQGRREVVECLIACLRAKISDCYDDKGKILPLKKMTASCRIALAEYSYKNYDQGQSERIKLVPKLGVAKLLAEMLGMMSEKDPMADEREQIFDADSLLTSRISELADRIRKAEVLSEAERSAEEESPLPVGFLG